MFTRPSEACLKVHGDAKELATRQKDARALGPIPPTLRAPLTFKKHSIQEL